MIKVHYIHLVCGFCQTYGTCKNISCFDCPVNLLEEIAKEKLKHPAPQEPEEEDGE